MRLEFHRAYYNNSEMHAYLANWIYQNQTSMDLVRPALWAGLVLFFAGLLPATYLDQETFYCVALWEETRWPEFDEFGECTIPRTASGVLAW